MQPFGPLCPPAGKVSSALTPFGCVSLNVRSAEPIATRVIGRGRTLWALSLGALGVVYGDIGTSPLYAVRECFDAVHGVAPTPANVLGVLSLITWALILVVMRQVPVARDAAPTTRAKAASSRCSRWSRSRRATVSPTRGRRALVLAGLFGASLLYADGMITPAISVLGAVEGLQVATPVFEHWVVPITLGDPGRDVPGAAPRHRAASAPSSVRRCCCGSSRSRPPACPGSAHARGARALNPGHAVDSWRTTARTASCCSARSCCASPAPRRSTRTWATSAAGRSGWRGSAWRFPRCSSTTRPGRGAARGRAGRGRATRSTRWCRAVWIYPMVAIATVAAVVASQAMISGAFSLTNQAVQLGYCPRLRVVHTSGHHEGQIYVPEVNTALMIACLALVVGIPELVGAGRGLRHRRDRHDDRDVGAVLRGDARALGRCARAGRAASLFLAVDLSFFGANMVKITHGGWLPLAIGALHLHGVQHLEARPARARRAAARRRRCRSSRSCRTWRRTSSCACPARRCS